MIDDGTPLVEADGAIEDADVLVRSPGVSIYKPLIQDALASRQARSRRPPACGWQSARAGT